jgi:ParB-like chromosome segregation protein Spo0J
MLREGKVKGQKTTAASWAKVPVRYVKGNALERDARNLVENLHRKNLDPLEEASAMEAYMQKHGVTQAQLARDIAMSEPYVSQRLALLRDTTEVVRQALRDGDITATQAREISAAPKEKQADIVASLKAQKSRGDKVTSADVREEVAANGPRVRKKTGRKALVVDQEKVSAAKEAYADKKFELRPRPALLECLGTLVIRERRNSTERTAHQIAALEFVLGIRDSL